MNARSLRFVSGGAIAGMLLAYLGYKKELAAIRDAVDGGSTIAETLAGDIEYGEAGEGEPTLVVHGAGGGYDQGLLIGRDMGEGYRIIAPSRFGYLKTPVPPDASPSAQADAHVALLDFLEIRRAIVVAASAGAPSAIEMALRHPERLSALILLAPRTYHPTQSVGADQSLPSQAMLRLIEQSADFLFWGAMHVSRGAVVRFLGVPPEVEANADEEERARVSALMKSLLPLSARTRGIEVDSLTQIVRWPLERLHVPTLVISAEDDLYRTLPGARFTAEQIPQAELEVLPSGGHLMVGRTKQVRKLVSEFLRRRRSKIGKTSRDAAQRKLEAMTA